jgi:hypothetical protein
MSIIPTRYVFACVLYKGRKPAVKKELNIWHRNCFPIRQQERIIFLKLVILIDVLKKANHSKGWDAKPLAYVLENEGYGSRVAEQNHDIS